MNPNGALRQAKSRIEDWWGHESRAVGLHARPIAIPHKPDSRYGLWRFLCAVAGRLLLLQLLLSFAASARAQGSQDGQGTLLRNLSLQQLGNIVVTSISKEPEQVWRTPAAIEVITQDDIRRSGATTLPQALRLAPGVQVARIDSDHWAIGIRGFGDGFAKSVLVLIDGRSVYTPLFAGVFWGLQDTRLEDIERIEVIRGPGGTIWGSNAVNGVINVITKPARQTHGVSAIVTGGNEDQGIGSFRYGAGNGQTFDYRLYGKVFSRGAEFHADHQNFDTWRMGQIGFRADWVLHGRDNLTIQGDSYRGGQGQRVAVGSFVPLRTVDHRRGRRRFRKRSAGQLAAPVEFAERHPNPGLL